MRPIVIHSRFNRIIAVVAWIVCAALVTTLLVDGGVALAWGYLAAALMVFLAWAALWRPAIVVRDGGVTLRNVSHSVDVPWKELVHVDTRYALTLHTPGQHFSAWAAPAPGALSGARAARHPANRETRAASEALRPGDLMGTESGDAATIVREQWRARIDAGAIQAGMAGTVPVRRHWDIPVLATTLALLALTGWALAATG